MIEGIFVDGLIFSIMALGIFISYKIMDLADLTCDGSFATGAAVAAVCIKSGLGITLALILGFAAGALSGMATALIHCRLRIPGLLAGILVMTMLYSVNLRILGGANVPLLGVKKFYTEVPRILGFLPSEWASLAGTIAIVLLMKGLVDLFFRTDLGLSVGAMGGNEQVVISQGMNPETLKVIGLGFSNGLIGFSGALLAQYQGFADANLGTGMVVQGLAAIMIGDFLFSTNRISLLTLRVILGSIIYKALMYGGRKYGYLVGITPNDFKLLTGLLVILSLAVAKARSGASDRGARRKAMDKVAAKANGGCNADA
ncbi:MAG: ABC transporter permease [Sphaerochaetaceae bacterium]|jgi:putative ABC transport system permease protein|nr:ABC transporter permease [Sphaerochaetaceae bacterium]